MGLWAITLWGWVLLGGTLAGATLLNARAGRVRGRLSGGLYALALVTAVAPILLYNPQAGWGPLWALIVSFGLLSAALQVLSEWFRRP